MSITLLKYKTRAPHPPSLPIKSNILPVIPITQSKFFLTVNMIRRKKGESNSNHKRNC